MNCSKKQIALRWSGQMLFGGIGYAALEILCRGYTHISMVMTGGVCFWVLLRLLDTKLCFALKCLMGGLSISLIEFAVGCVVNLWMGLEVWDYSQETGQLLGQVCIRFFLLWCALAALVLLCHQYLRRWGTRLRASAVLLLLGIRK